MSLHQDETTRTFDPELEGIQAALSFGRPWEVGDGLSDTYKQLWDIATEPEERFKRRMRFSDEGSLTTAESRRNKLVNRLGILAFTEDEIRVRLAHYATTQDQPDLTSTYKAALQQIREAYDITPDVVDARRQQLESSPRMRPYFL